LPIQFTEKWDQYGLMAELALKLEGSFAPVWKNGIAEACLYFAGGLWVPCGYDYILYNYGPYSEALADDLSFFASMDGVKIRLES
jgi:hypothetical protein